MVALTGSTCLEIWERGRRLHSLDRGLLALSFSRPEVPPESLADWPLGRRNWALLDMHRKSFGTLLEARGSCSGCEEQIELELDVRDFLIEREREAGVTTVLVEGHLFRLPTSRDLSHIASENDIRSAALRLIERCRVTSEDSTTLSPAEVENIESQMAVADPLSEIRLSLCCPSCSHEWEEQLDVTSFLWAQIEAYGKRVLWEVHTLALAYGWTEAEVLSIGESRRHLYIEMVRGLSTGRNGREMFLENLPGRITG